jgi:hypothetical protein
MGRKRRQAPSLFEVSGQGQEDGSAGYDRAERKRKEKKGTQRAAEMKQGGATEPLSNPLFFRQRLSTSRRRPIHRPSPIEGTPSVDQTDRSPMISLSPYCLVRRSV